MVLQPHCQKLRCCCQHGTVLQWRMAQAGMSWEQRPCFSWLSQQALAMRVIVESTPPAVDAGTAEGREVGTFLESCGVQAQHTPPTPQEPWWLRWENSLVSPSVEARFSFIAIKSYCFRSWASSYKNSGDHKEFVIIAFKIGIHLSGNTYVLLIRMMASKPQGLLLNWVFLYVLFLELLRFLFSFREKQ